MADRDDVDIDFSDWQSGTLAEASLELPDGAVVSHGIFMVAYFDDQGQEMYCYGGQGESSIGATLGLIELVKGRMLNRVFHPEADG